MSEAELKAAELKAEANTLFGQKQYQRAAELYTEALEHAPDNAILYANRSACWVRLESAGSAMADATKAIELDPEYVKAYYRLGSAHLALGKYKLALNDFAQVVRKKPKDKVAMRRYKQCKQLFQREQFERAIASERTVPVSETIDLSALSVPADYSGPVLPEDGMSQEFLDQLMSFYEEQGRLPLKFVYSILLQAKAELDKLGPVVDIRIGEEEHVTVFGDVHGQYFDLVHALRNVSGLPSPTNPIIFNGDLVDRGSWSVEVIMLLLAYKVMYPEHVHIARGNHETKSMNKVYGFEGEVKAKYNEKCMDLFTEIFQALPLVHLINEKVFVTHGGLFTEDGITIEQLRAINRFKEPADSGPMCELLWSDPLPGSATGRQPSKRGVGIGFGQDVTRAFLEANSLELIVRSHEVREEGYSVEHDGRLITIFSAPNYCDNVGNKAAVVKFGFDLKPQFVQFTHVPHPDMKPMAYASTYNSLM